MTSFGLAEIEGYPRGREAFIVMVANELQKAAAEALRLEFWCTPRFGGGHFEMRARPKSLT